MKEYIFEIEEEEIDEAEVFYGWIRKHSRELIRCKDCKHYADECCDRYADETLGYVHSTQEYGYCWVAERKDNEID